MNDLLSLCLFGVDLLVTVVAAWLLLRAVAPGRTGLEQILGWGLGLLMVVAGTGEVAGWCGVFGASGFFVLHAATMLGLAVARKSRLTADEQALRELWHNLSAHFRNGGSSAWLAGTLWLVLVGQGVLAAWGRPVVFDALTYRLSRIALWLQDGRIAHFSTDDARLNYMPVAPDVVMAWFLGAHGAGFQWAALAQTFGGALLLGATVGLARCSGLSRGASLGAAGIIFGMANVVPQFTSAYTDLLTAGVFATALFLWLAALRQGEGSVLGGAGLALAFGAKGTMFYLLPGGLLAAAWLGWRQHTPWRIWRPTLFAAVVATLLFVCPGLMRNWRDYGRLFAPAEAMNSQHGGGFSPGERARKLQLNLTSTLAQLFEPNAQPPGLRAASLRAGAVLARDLPESDPFAFEELNRRANVERVLHLAGPDADVASCGVLIVVLFTLGMVTALVRPRRAGAELVLIWSLATVSFVVSLYSLLQWHPYSFRFWILVAPWMAVVAAWWIETLPRVLAPVVWTMVAVSSAAVFCSSTLHAYQSGWAAVFRPEQATSFSVFAQARGWSLTLEPAGDSFLLALPVNWPLAVFLRLNDGRRVELRRLSELPDTAEKAVQAIDGWLIVPARHFAGHEGRVEKRVWLFYGDDHSPFSIAAYRRTKL